MAQTGATSTPPSNETILRLVIVGDTATGKTSLLLRYTDDKFSTNFTTTIGIDFRLKTMQFGGKTVKVQIFDTAGQERFHAITQAYYRNADGALLVYDITNQASFEHVGQWVKEMTPYTESTVKFLVGNKSDLESSRVVKTEQGMSLAKEVGYHFMETSALSGTNVEKAFENMIHRVLEQKGFQSPPPAVIKPLYEDPDHQIGGGRSGCPC